MIEYFEGILFLTTNRFEAIEGAFMSRIHVAVSYPALSTNSRRQLWQSLIARACDDRIPRWSNRRFLDQVALSEVNGRKIKNIVRMEHGLARHGKQAMKSEDIFQGIAALKLFDEDIAKGQVRRVKQH